MKIKTITCHDVYNVGASLQAYALMKYLSDQDHNVEIIDYKPEYLSHHYELFYADNPAYRKNIFTKILYVIVKLPKKIKQQKRKRIFDDFTDNYLNLTKKYTSNKVLKEDCPKADLYIAGSDQIWNPLFQNGKDPAFYLDFAPKTAIKASYAASFAVDKFPEANEKMVSEFLKKFDYISVREKSGLDVLRQLGITQGCEVLDPVFLLDNEKWEKLAGDMPLIHEKYILIYDFERSEMIEYIARKIAKKYKLKIVSIFKSKNADINFVNNGPLEFLNLIRNAEYVVSNSFHATAFSIIFRKNFYVVGRTEKINKRMVDLLDKIDLNNRYVVSQEFSEETIDYTFIEKKIDSCIMISKNYLKTVLGKGLKKESDEL